MKNYILDLKREFQGYNSTSFMKDLFAGITLAAVALPLALAFGVSAGASAAAGMITAIIAGIVIGTLSGASYLISGPTGAMSAILIGLTMQYGLQGVFIAGFLSGIILILCSLFKLGKVLSFIPSSVISGFTSGIAIIIATGQIDNFFGSASHGEGVIEQFAYYFNHGFSVEWTSILFGVMVVAIMVCWPKKYSFVPASLIALLFTLILNITLQFDVIEVGSIPSSLIADDRLHLFSINLSTINELILPAISIAALGMIESLLCGASGGKMKKEKMNADRELFAQGLGNMLIPFFGGVPATAAIARTSVAIKSGAKTRVVSIVHSLVLVASMFLFAPFMSKIPMAALAGVLMVTAFRMNEWKEINYMFSKRLKTSIAQFLVTMIATVIFDLTIAILLGIVVSMILFVAKNATLHITSTKVDAKRIQTPLQYHHKDSVVLYVSGPLFFANQEKLLHAFECQAIESSAIIISMRGVSSIDESGANELKLINESAKHHDCEVYLCGIQETVKQQLHRYEVENLYQGYIMWDALEAIQMIDSKYYK